MALQTRCLFLDGLYQEDCWLLVHCGFLPPRKTDCYYFFVIQKIQIHTKKLRYMHISPATARKPHEIIFHPLSCDPIRLIRHYDSSSDLSPEHTSLCSKVKVSLYNKVLLTTHSLKPIWAAGMERNSV